MQEKIWHFFVAACAYFLAGKLGLSLAIPPGFASAVWPAAGLALACLLLCNPYAALAGIGVGSFLINLGLSSDQYNHIHLQSILPAAWIACGAMAQATGGYYLHKRYIGLRNTLDNPSNILTFCLLVCIVACTIGCSMGSAALYFNGIIPASAIPFTWLTWWVGDSIGVLLFTPLLLSIFSQHNFSLRRKLQIAVPTLVIFTVTWWIFVLSLEKTRQEQNFILEKTTDYFSHEIIDNLHKSAHRLNAYRAFFNANPNFSQTQFNRFSAVILEEDSIFQGIGWTRIIKAGERKNLEQQYQQQGYKDFHLTEFDKNGKLQIATEQQEYYPVLYIYPLEQNKKAFGLNLAANPARKEALLNARQLHRAVATAPITLAQETAHQKATILYLPVYTTATNTQDGGDFLGYISGVLRINSVLGSLLEESKNRGISLNLTDVTDANNPLKLLSDDTPVFNGLQAKEYTAEFGERLYAIRVYPNVNYTPPPRNWTSWLIITAGFLIAAMLQVFILIITGSYEHVRQQVERKTRDLTFAIAEANAANQAKSVFLANMSHELRTPLNSIIGFLHLCLKTPLSSKQQDYLHKADLSSATLLALINQSLDYAKIESGNIELEQHEVSVLHLLEKIYAIFSRRAEETKLNFAIKASGEIPNLLNGDALRIEQILLNLLSNAFKFTAQGEVNLTVEYNQQQEQLILVVHDTGIGISAEHVSSIFEAFRQADTSTSRRYGGTGLGLSISKQLAILMGGDIHLTSTPGNGSRFRVYLQLPPAGDKTFDNMQLQNTLHQLQHSDTTFTASEIILTPENPLPLKGKYILLAEDMEMNQILAQTLLEVQGAEITIAENGKIALQKLQQGPLPDLILMDIQMPEMDGYETTRMIRNNPAWQHIPILAMTANAMESDIRKCLATGMQGHIAKPIHEEKMLASILQFIDKL
ncbi:MAG: CHASE domain-containing protein [Oceanospirillaceae bacterium]|nr:CHASE domain-containing protein [Oceanospirillaceae bacterium]MCP5335591.1 CHASE domain-containing protein [Oceanospirillaceae bacterium]